MDSRAAAIVCRLRTQVDLHLSGMEVTNLTLVASGMEFVVCRGDSPTYGPLAFRVPWERHFANDNDESIDARDLLRQEATLASHARCFGIPTPEVRHLHMGDDGFDFLVSEFMLHDGSCPDRREFGQLMRTIHDCPVPDIAPVMQGGREIADVITERLLRRSRIIEKIAGVDLTLPDTDSIRGSLDQSTGRASLLHMDARPENLLTRRKSIIAVVDWSNALVGSPALDLARIDEYGHLDSDFRDGYGINEAADVSPSQRLLYQLDTAAMLAVVFLSEAPNAERAKPQVERVIRLFEAFRRTIA